MSKQNIGLYGFGCVGQGLFKTLEGNSKNINARISKICVKTRGKNRILAEDRFIYDQDAILNDKDIDIVVELIDDAKAAFYIVTEALKRGKAVVTANKKMVAENLEELIRLQEEYSAPLLYEGAVCGSIPIIRTLEDYYSAEHIEEIKGIFNGSTNYIMTKVFQEGKEYDDALHEAQVAGFAESDPTLDVGGFDPKYKLAIVLQHTFGVSVHPEKIFNWGIQNITEADVRFAQENGLKIKLLSSAVINHRKISTYVAPHFISDDSPLFHVENEYNSVLLHGEFVDNQVLIGKGAGSLPTGLAVLSDVEALTNNYKYRYAKRAQKLDFDIYSGSVEVYLSFRDIAEVEWSQFDNISEKYIGKNSGHIIGTIGFDRLVKLLKLSGEHVNVIFTSGKHEQQQLSKMTYSYAG
ncbi:MAG: homoserine dehydrogenase [Bacteroidota bacterium]